MPNAVRERHKHWQLLGLLSQYPSLRIAPSGGTDLTLCGSLRFHVIGNDRRAIADEYAIELTVPSDFPRSLALARETGGRIPRSYHKLRGNYLCLGTPTEQRLVLSASPTLPSFVERLLIPYLYGYSHFERYGTMPFGEQRHGIQGLRDHLGQLYRAPAVVGVEEFLLLTAMKKRSANKVACPCQSGQRLGRCHNRIVNRLRSKLSRRWFRDEYKNVCISLRE